MANFPSFTFTAAGRAAITRSLSGKNVDRLIITKCVLGDGVYSGDIDSLKDVTSPKMTVTVSEYTDNGDGTSVTRFVYDNASLDVGFSHREMGIYAKNGDSGTELLLCYSNAGNQYSYIRAGTVDSVTKQRKATIPPQTFKFVLATGGSGSVNAVIDPKGYVDVEMLEEHNTDPTAHPDIRQMLNSYLPLTGGTVTGTLNVSTQDTMDNSTKVANTAFVQSAVANKVSQLVNGAPTVLDTLNELSSALGNDPNFATTVATQIGNKVDKTELNNNLELHNADVNAHTPILEAIKAISGMSAYDIAPSKTIDAIIQLLGFGGIVAQNLEDNGYIKFANGLTLQFGLTGDVPRNGTYQVNYPIAFTNLLYAGGFATINGDAGNLDAIKMYNLPNQYNMTLLNTADGHTARTYWLAIGLI